MFTKIKILTPNTKTTTHFSILNYILEKKALRPVQEAFKVTKMKKQCHLFIVSDTNISNYSSQFVKNYSPL